MKKYIVLFVSMLLVLLVGNLLLVAVPEAIGNGSSQLGIGFGFVFAFFVTIGLILYAHDEEVV